MTKVGAFLYRLLRGEDVVLVSQSKDQWNRQFADGKWDRLQEGQANTTEIARLICTYAESQSERLRVLDVGCGNGGLARLLAHDFSIAYTGIDISETAIATAKAAVPQGRFIVADAATPPSDIGVFDVVVFNEVFFYINPNHALPLYRGHTTPATRVVVSIIRSWRTPFLFRRLRRHLQMEQRITVSDYPHTWNLLTARFI